MNRPSFRTGLAVGLLGAAAAVLVKAVQGHRAATHPPAPAPSTDWPPITGVAPSPVPATPAPAGAPPATADLPDATPAPEPDDEPSLAPPEAGSLPGGGAVSGREIGPTDPEPEAVLPEDRIDEARSTDSDVAGGTDPADVPPAPEPTFGTAPDPEHAATSPVPVATPVDAEPEQELPVPHRSSPAASGEASEDGAWVEPEGGSCPGSHPVKAKLASSIFHLPGMSAYERTVPDRCYVDAAAAEADGLRAAKR